ncbi:hypothetical protein NDU88_013159 [Pleurodeles waltl]|uniref:Uncharacterized protein n=1 Tax=Pleurodeles waltl TaxID=8319 RepID=A0AAV7R6G2_PLEWA|nr:hypothetical protein NDU88_013159 [Pleurodeles waltl]
MSYASALDRRPLQLETYQSKTLVTGRSFLLALGPSVEQPCCWESCFGLRQGHCLGSLEDSLGAHFPQQQLPVRGPPWQGGQQT